MAARKPDTLELTVQYLAKRDGIDKVLKLLRYSAKLLLVTAFAGSNSEAAQRLRSFESSVGNSRKAYRLGKFLAGLDAARKVPVTSRFSLLELAAAGGESLYYFVEQAIWLVKAGVLDKRHAARLQKASAWAELVALAATITLGALRCAVALERETALLAELTRLKKEGEGSEETVGAIRREVGQLRARRALHTLKMVQDFADALLAVADVRESKGLLANPILLACCGLLSGAISARKNWRSISAR